jgi:transcriptional regulator with XRE-family HTH domain
VSQEAFADMCELDRTYIGGIERGERNVALVNIEKIAKTLRLSIAQFFRGPTKSWRIGPSNTLVLLPYSRQTRNCLQRLH